MTDKVDVAARFYVRLEDRHPRSIIWDATPLDGYTWDNNSGFGVFTWDSSPMDGNNWDRAITLQERLIESNKRRLRGLQ